MASTNTQLMASVALSRTLRRLREARELKIVQVAEALNVDDSTLSRIENAKRACTKEMFDQLMELYGIAGDELAELTDLHASTRERQPTWWSKYDDVISANYSRFLGFEASAAVTYEYQVALVPGLLQTERYARAVTGVGFASLGPDQVDGLTEVRGHRQRLRILETSQPLECHFVLSEAVLHFEVGGKDVHQEQLQQLHDLSQRDFIDLRVIPWDRGAEGTQTGAFVVFGFANTDVPDVGFSESVTGMTLLDDPRDLRRLHRLFRNLSDSALSAEKTRDLIARVRGD